MRYLLLVLALLPSLLQAQYNDGSAHPTSQPFTPPLGYGIPVTIVGNGVGASTQNVAGSLILRDTDGGFASGKQIINPLNASTTSQVILSIANQTADQLDISSPTATSPTIRFTAKGQVLFKRLTVTQIDTEVPDAVGAVIICTNCTIPYSLCTATGTAAAQWARAGSSTVGCGTNN